MTVKLGTINRGQLQVPYFVKVRCIFELKKSYLSRQVLKKLTLTVTASYYELVRFSKALVNVLWERRVAWGKQSVGRRLLITCRIHKRREPSPVPFPFPPFPFPFLPLLSHTHSLRSTLPLIHLGVCGSAVSYTNGPGRQTVFGAF